jgi:hypothetical protein
MNKVWQAILIISAAAFAANPCEDSNYLDLKNKKIAEMTDKEYQYFIEKDRMCTNMFVTKAGQDSVSGQVREAPKEKPPASGGVKVWEVGVLLYGLAAVISTIMLISLFS